MYWVRVLGRMEATATGRGVPAVKIFYGICGEGLGHCSRSLALIERLESLGHQVTIFTFADACQLLVQSRYQPHRVTGLQFHQKSNGDIDTLRSAGNFWSYLRSQRESVDLIRQLAIAERPDLFITDFEPLTATVAASMRIPCFSIDNQHRFCHPLEKDFPFRLRAYARLAGEFVRWWIKRPRQCIVSVFHNCPPSRQYASVDVLLRDRVMQLQPVDGEMVLLYGRGGLGQRMAQIASTVPLRFRVYGCHGEPAEYRVQTDELRGIRSGSRRVPGGYLHWGAAVDRRGSLFWQARLVVPIPGQHEQEINARYGGKERVGDFCGSGISQVKSLASSYNGVSPLGARRMALIKSSIC